MVKERAEWLALYRAELLTYAWAGDPERLARYLAAVEETIDGGLTWNLDPESPALVASWEAAGLPGRPNLGALRRAYGTRPIPEPERPPRPPRVPRPRGVTVAVSVAGARPGTITLAVYRLPVRTRGPLQRVVVTADAQRLAVERRWAVAPFQRWREARELARAHATPEWPAHSGQDLGTVLTVAALAVLVDAGATRWAPDVLEADRVAATAAAVALLRSPVGQRHARRLVGYAEKHAASQAAAWGIVDYTGTVLLMEGAAQLLAETDLVPWGVEPAAGAAAA